MTYLSIVLKNEKLATNLKEMLVARGYDEKNIEQTERWLRIKEEIYISYDEWNNERQGELVIKLIMPTDDKYEDIPIYISIKNELVDLFC